MGTVTDPVTGSGSCPAWTASVENPMRLYIDVLEEVEAGQDARGLAVIVHRDRGVAPRQDLHRPRKMLAERHDRKRLFEQVLDAGVPVGGAAQDLLEQNPFAHRSDHVTF